jgi:hypothetical protein
METVARLLIGLLLALGFALLVVLLAIRALKASLAPAQELRT